jgi:putative membrane protein insertion efficiency factor
MTRILSLPLLAVLWVYRKLISPVLPPACRYYPSCSQYAAEAVRIHGPLLGSWLAVRRLSRCHPWARGGPDPVPARARMGKRVA